jgi:hypothetical protein
MKILNSELNKLKPSERKMIADTAIKFANASLRSRDRQYYLNPQTLSDTSISRALAIHRVFMKKK